MTGGIDIEKFKAKAKLADRYAKQLERLHAKNTATACIEEAVEGALTKLGGTKTAMVIYGEPQSGKTEMMICLTAKLLDEGHRVIVHLMNDSVDLLTQNLRRFKGSGLAPAARNSSELLPSFVIHAGQELVVFCKKNAKDLDKLIERLVNAGQVVVIDDEADYATPNAKVNAGAKTKINELIEKLIGPDGRYIGVTATPARLDLNNTFSNDTSKWVQFPAHAQYTGQDVFFPIERKSLPYRLRLLGPGPEPDASRNALVRFLATSAYLNLHVNSPEQNYTMLVHTSGKKKDHETDRATIEQAVQALSDVNSANFESLVTLVHVAASELYPSHDADHITEYVVKNASRIALVVLNSERDRTSAGESATEASSPFTVIIGGNIVSRGVTFPNLLVLAVLSQRRNLAARLRSDGWVG